MLGLNLYTTYILKTFLKKYKTIEKQLKTFKSLVKFIKMVSEIPSYKTRQTVKISYL